MLSLSKIITHTIYTIIAKRLTAGCLLTTAIACTKFGIRRWCTVLLATRSYKLIFLHTLFQAWIYKIIKRLSPEQAVIGLTQESHEALIEKAVKAIRKQDVVNCVKHVNELLK